MILPADKRISTYGGQVYKKINLPFPEKKSKFIKVREREFNA